MRLGLWTAPTSGSTAHSDPLSPVLAPTRRQMLGAGAGFAAAGFSLRQARASDDPPYFETARHQFTILEPREPPPSSQFHRLDGKPVSLAEWRGKTVLLNFWASWCPQCRTELPELDKLQAGLDPKLFQVLAISTDHEGRKAVDPYLKSFNLKHLALALDPEGALGRPMASDRSENPAPITIYGMPMSYVLDKQGRICGYIVGAADWASPAGLGVLNYYAAHSA